MWDDIIAELAEESHPGSATQTRTGADGVVRTLTYGTVPAGSISDATAWVAVAADGVTLEEKRVVDEDTKDADKRKFRDVTGKRAATLAKRLNGLEKPPEKAKRSGKPDTLPAPSSNGHAS